MTAQNYRQLDVILLCLFRERFPEHATVERLSGLLHRMFGGSGNITECSGPYRLTSQPVN